MCCGTIGVVRQDVREDRTIHVDADGNATFQHGQNGVFVTDAQTGAPKRIYEPAPEDIAVSPPAWEPGGKRMVFTVARALDGQLREPGDAPADGSRYSEIPIRYTCFLHDPAGGPPEKLFEALAGHAGYVAAGLAVCWHPDGKRLDFVLQTDTNRHSLRTFDIATRLTSDHPLPYAENVALDSAPNRPRRYALLGGTEAGCGLWIEGTDGKWWCVPESVPQTAHLEDLRQRLPRWSRDGSKLAFTDGAEVRVCDTATRKSETWFRSAQKPDPPRFAPQHVADLHWHPDGARIGLLNGTCLELVASTGREIMLTDAPVVAFAGWNAVGTRMAYVTREQPPYFDNMRYATLFVPNVEARTAVRVADADGANAKVLVSGLRATFPHWAPGDSRLSVWLTVEPPYRLIDLGSNGMRPGDPAALIDPEAGTLDWLPVNGTEHAQIGHAELRAGRIDAALKRFDWAAAALPADGKADWMAFRAIALQKAGRADEAKAAWKQFAPPEPRRPELRAPGVMAPEAVANLEAITPRHRFIAEAFVSLELASEGIDYFHEQLKSSDSDAERLSAAFVLCQLLLLTDRKVEYAECAIDHLLPAAVKIAPNANTSAMVAWTVLPLGASEFIKALPEETVRRMCKPLGAHRQADDMDFVCCLALRACGRRLKDEKLTDEAQARIANHAAESRWRLTNDAVDAALLSRVQAFGEIFGADPALRPSR
jgi:hypothetical protein